MNLRDEVTRIRNEIEADILPCTEAAREIGLLLNDTTIHDCEMVEVCMTEPVIGLNEPF